MKVIWLTLLAGVAVPLLCHAQTPIVNLSYAYSPTWVRESDCYTLHGNGKRPEAIRANSSTGADIPVDGNWYAIDLTRVGVGAAAISVTLSGLNLITHGDSGLADLWVALRAPGSTLSADYYIGQVTTSTPLSGERSGMSGVFPVVNGVIEVALTPRVNQAPYTPLPSTLPAFGVNFTVQRWCQ
jgi:hypothetical protein